MNWFDLKDDVAVVIGGTGVLGGALAEGLARAGAAVAVAGRAFVIARVVAAVAAAEVATAATGGGDVMWW